MISLYKIKYFIVSLLLILCFAGCSDGVEVETGNDPDTEAEKYVDVYEPSLDGMFDDDFVPSGKDDDLVIVHNQDNKKYTEGNQYDASLAETKEIDTPVVPDEFETDVSKNDSKESDASVVVVPVLDDNSDAADNAKNSEEIQKEAVKEENNIDETTDNKSEASEAKPLVEESNPESAAYILNTNTKKFHYPSCGSAKQIKDKNKGFGNNRDTIIAQGFVPCKRCNP